ncbi:sugar isomerase domain-containing protein [Aquimarina hainanensis]|uniref:Sugar isomerase domain-containing protein n=1 Tax=Aquimarina hainanensis TaxID=1578017 RepID=A0ABW5NEZ3_9FLAO
MFEYIDQVQRLIDHLRSDQEESIKAAATVLTKAIKEDRIIHTLGTGHSQMIAMELFGRASGIANVSAMLDELLLLSNGARRSAAIEQVSGLASILWDKYNIETSDVLIIISNSGRNAIPIEMAQIAKAAGVKIIAITSLEQSKKYNSRHKSGQKLYQLADIVIDNCVPSGDGVMHMNNELFGPVSSIMGMVIVNTIVTEAIKECHRQNIPVTIYQSQNIDHTDNDRIYKQFESRIPHL